MIGYFRINDPYRLVGLFLLLLALYLPLFILDDTITVPELNGLLLGEKLNEGFRMYRGVIDDTGPLAAWMHELLDTLFGRSILIRHVIGFLLIFLQCAYLAFLLISRRVFPESTYIPAFLCGLLFFFSYDTVSLTADLMGSVFLLLALHSLLQEIEFRHESDEGILAVGMSISLASLFSFAFAVYILAAILILAFFTRSGLRRFLLLGFAFLLPHLLTLTIYFLYDATDELWEYYYLANLSPGGLSFIDWRSLLTLSAVPLFYVIISIVMLNREARFSKYQSQILQAMVIWLLGSVLFTFWSGERRPQTLIVFIPGLAFLFSHFFFLIRRVRFVRLNAWLLFLGIVAVAYLARFGVLEAVNYRPLWVDQTTNVIEGKRLLILDGGLDGYYRNELATPFLDWRLSREIFEHPAYYENVTTVYDAFRGDPPDIVFDPHNLLAPFLLRMPTIQEQYVRQGTRYVRVSN